MATILFIWLMAWFYKAIMRKTSTWTACNISCLSKQGHNYWYREPVVIIMLCNLLMFNASSNYINDMVSFTGKNRFHDFAEKCRLTKWTFCYFYFRGQVIQQAPVSLTLFIATLIMIHPSLNGELSVLEIHIVSYYNWSTHIVKNYM